jgi:HTH-type transcriptional regulator / antitoxin HigA
MPTIEAAAPWTPDWAMHPGDHLAEHLDVRGMSQAEFARLADMTAKHVSTIINGDNPVTPETAIKLQRVTGMKDYIWTGLQAQWDLHQAREREHAALERAADWASKFPIKELAKRGVIATTTDTAERLNSLLAFLGIGSPDAFDARANGLAVQHRQSKAHATSTEHVVAWLMLGERRARQLQIPAYDEAKFLDAVDQIRALTVHRPNVFEPKMKALCAASGVALIFEKPVQRTCLFGSARWLDGDRAVIQMSLRMRSNDHFWWTFFHEAAHLVLHKGKNFADDAGGEGDGAEDEADEWACDKLVDVRRFEAFKATRPRSATDVQRFANEIGIHPGIVVGMLQHERIVPHDHLNGLKDRFIWADEAD